MEWSGDVTDPANALDSATTPDPATAPSSGLSATFSPCEGEKGLGEKGQREEDARDMCIEYGEQAGWLAPIALESPRTKVRGKATDQRASNKGCLPMTLAEYLRLLD